MLSYTDVFELIEFKLKEQGIELCDLAKIRLAGEKELSKSGAPRLTDIYGWVINHKGDCTLSAAELANLEWETDKSLVYPREGMAELLAEIVSLGKTIIVTTDTYYDQKQIEELLRLMGYSHIDRVYVSSELNISKATGLYQIIKTDHPNKKILHIGDDEYVDVEKASEYGFRNFYIYGAKTLFEKLGELGLANDINLYADKTKIGLMLSRLLSNPFRFEKHDLKISINNAEDIGYYICGPMVLDFALWFKDKLSEIKAESSLLLARDGYLMKNILEKIKCKPESVYFLTSRTSAIRAGIENEEDIAYVDSMKFFGSFEENMLTRYGIILNKGESKNAAIINKSKTQRTNYRAYISKLNIGSGTTVVFDFVAKGTIQLFLQKIMHRHLKGLYFLQLEPEFMADKDIEIESFYTEAERDKSAIFDSYYILESILTSPMPSVNEFDSDGNPVYAEETRSEENIKCVLKMQQGILNYVDDYLKLVPSELRVINKQLDERLLSLIGKFQVTDEKFRSLVVEDPFFGRMTAMEDVL